MANSIDQENPAYTYSLYAGGKDGDSVMVTGRLPQEWLVSTGSNWEGNAAGDTTKEIASSIGGAVSGVAEAAVTVGGNNYGFTALANRQWAGARPLTWNLLAEFNAEDSALEDVIRPVVLLQSMSMAAMVANPAITLPNDMVASAGAIIGPAYWQNAEASGQVGGKSLIQLRIGEMFVFDDIIVEDVNITNNMRLARPGLPIKAVAEIQVSTRGPVTFNQFVESMTGKAMQGLFGNGSDRISAAKRQGAGRRAGYSELASTSPTR